MDGKEGGNAHIAHEISKHLTGVHKVRCVGADQRCFQNAEPIIRLKSV